MKILHVIPYYYPALAYGGTPKAVQEIAERQAEQGHSVVVLTTTAYEKNKSLEAGSITNNGVKIIRLNNLSNFIMWKYHFSTPLGVFSFLKKNKFDVIHLHELRTLLNLFVLMFPSLPPLIISPWGTAPYNQSLVLPKKIFDRLLLPLVKKKVVTALVQTRHEKTIVKELGLVKRSKLIPLAINFKEFVKISSQAASRKKLGIDRDAFVYLFLGRFSPQKGLDFILRAFKQVSEQVPNAYLLLVGRDDNYMPTLKELISQLNIHNKVFLHEPLYEKDRLKAYASADAFIFAPSVYEETGTVCLEALACRVPVITTKQAEIPFFTEHDGVIHSVRTELDFARNMLSVYQKKSFVNIKKLRKYFDWSQVSSIMLYIYSKYQLAGRL